MPVPDIYLYAGEATVNDVKLRDPTTFTAPPPPGDGTTGYRMLLGVGLTFLLLVAELI